MSYDYLLVKAKPGADLLSLMGAEGFPPIGALDEVKASLTQLFPAVRWDAPMKVPGSDATSVMGLLGPPEFHLMLEGDNQVVSITMSHAEREEIEKVTRALDLTALDEQSMEAFGG